MREGSKVTLVKLHESFHVPDVGDTTTTFGTDGNRRKFDETDITKGVDGLYCTVSRKGKTVSFWIPTGNIAGAIFKDEATS